MYAICHLSVVPVRSEPSDRSEMTSQLLFGETMEILEERESWRRVRMLYDNYTGWIDRKQVIQVGDEEIGKINSIPLTVTLDIVQIVVFSQSNIIPVVLGSSLPQYENKKFRMSGIEYLYDGNIKTYAVPDTSRLIEHAYMYLNAPYLWGGRSPFGIDCSGFTQLIFKLCGMSIQRDSFLQAEQGKAVGFPEEAKPGDLAFFDNAQGKIVHVGMILPEHKIIHASGRVRIDKLDHQGIFNAETNKYTHSLKTIRRFF